MRLVSSVSRSRGFTLLEMLVALSLFALLGVLGNRLLSNTLMIDERMQRQFDQQQQMRQLFLILHDDLEQIVPRATRSGDAMLPVFYQEPASGAVSFVRGGYGNPFVDDGKRSRLLKVRYQLGKHPYRDQQGSRYYRDQRQYLLRIVSTELDQREAVAGDDQREQVQALLVDVERFNLLPMFAGGGSFADRSVPLLPKSVLLDISGKGIGRLTHTIMVR